MFIPLYGKAFESTKKTPILLDTKAIEIVKKIAYDSESLKIPGKTYTMMCLMTMIIDNFVKDYLHDKNKSIILLLGCRLESRFDRVNNSNVDWYDLDFKEVIDPHQNLYPEYDK